MAIVLLRIDDRLIHGQVVVGWARFLEADKIVVADNAVADDPTQKILYEMVVPPHMHVSILHLPDAAKTLSDDINSPSKTIVLFSRPQDVLSYWQSGGPVKCVNIGGMRYEPGKKQIAPSISVSEEDLAIFKELHKHGIELEGRAVPTDVPLDITKFF